MAGFWWRKNLDDKAPEIDIMVAGGDIAAGDMVKQHSVKGQVVIGEASDPAYGVAMNGGTASTKIAVIRATPNNIFEAKTETTGYTDATHRMTLASLETETTAAQTIKAGDTADKNFMMIGLAPGEKDAEAGNKVWGYFHKTIWSGGAEVVTT